jgi:hypothetical protein
LQSGRGTKFTGVLRADIQQENGRRVLVFVAARTHVSPIRYTDQTTLYKAKENTARPDSKRGMYLTALQNSRDVEEAKRAYAKVDASIVGPKIPFGEMLGWAVRLGYVGLGKPSLKS